MEPMIGIASLSGTELADLIMDNVFDIIVAYDHKGRVMLWNKGAEEWFSISREAAIGKTVSELMPGVGNDDRLAYLNRALNGESIYLNEEASRYKPAYYRQKMVPMQTRAGTIHGVLVVAKDLTREVVQRQEAEALNEQLSAQNGLLEARTQLLQAVLNASVDLIAVYDQELRFMEVNRRLDEYLRPHSGNVIGKKLTEALPQHAASAYRQHLEEALGGKESVLKNYPFTLKAGFCNLHFLPLADENGRVTGVLQLTHDITELKEANDALNEKNSALESINHELSAFAAAANHDLKKPLNKIRVFSEFLIEKELGNLSEDGRKYLLRLQQASRDAQSIISGTLDYYSSFTAGTSQDTIDVAQLVGDIAGKIGLPHSAISCDQFELKGNARRLATVFEQLISNAAKFRHPDRPLQVRISCRKLEKGATQMRYARSYSELVVEDNGIGFHEDYNEKVFDIFFRVHSTFEYPGHGIGLSICRRIITSKGGTITAEGRPEAGTRITILLPQ